jgi:hypothetical protein
MFHVSTDYDVRVCALPLHKMIEVVDKSDVVVVRFEDDVRVDVLQGVDGSVYFGETSLPSMLSNIFFLPR